MSDIKKIYKIKIFCEVLKIFQAIKYFELHTVSDIMSLYQWFSTRALEHTMVLQDILK